MILIIVNKFYKHNFFLSAGGTCKIEVAAERAEGCHGPGGHRSGKN